MTLALVAARTQLARWALDGRGAARGRTARTALVLEVELSTGARGRGEAAPLPGFSPDTLDDAARALEALVASLPRAVTGLDAIAALAAEVAPTTPAARFAIETALLAALAADHGTTLAALLEAACVIAPCLPPSTVVDGPGESAAPYLKVKVGDSPFADDLARVRAIAGAAPGARLRLDANRAWSRTDAPVHLAALAGLPIDYVEEPCPDAHELLDLTAIPIALDESLATLAPTALDAALRAPRLGALILKPTLLGLSGALAIAARARAANIPVLVTHALESPVGRAACEALATALAARAGEPAVITRSRTLAFGALAAVTPPPARCVVAEPSIATLAAVHAALAERRPIALLHAKLAPAELARQQAAVERAALPPHTAAILFTSGSTGAARGVVLSRDALDAAAAASARHLGWRPGDRWLLALSLAHAGGLAIAVRCLAARVPVALVEDPADLPASLATCTLASLVPTQLASLLEDPGWRPPPQLRAVLLGGAAAPPALLAAAAARGVPFLTTYGMTESFGQVATMPPARAGDPAAPLVALPGVTLRAGAPTAPAPITVRGPMLASSYLDGAPIAPALTTADLGWLDPTGALHIAGRADDVIITGGENVHPLAVEAVLTTTPGVLAAVAFGLPDPRWGQLVAAALVVAPGFDLPTAAARWHAALPPSARPRRLALLAALPLSATGKPDRRAAAQLPTVPLAY